MENKRKKLPPGTAMIIDGKLLFAEDFSDNQTVKLFIGDNVVVKVDGSEVNTFVEINKKNKVEIFPVKIPPKVNLDIKFSENNLEAALFIEKEKGIQFVVNNTPAAEEIKVAANGTEEIPPPEVTKEEIFKKIQEMGIVEGLDYDAIDRLANGVSDNEIIARGILPKEGKDASLKVLYTKKAKKEKETNKLIGNRKIEMVEKGDLLLEKIPPVEGVPGKDVFGQIVPPPPVRDIQLKEGPGVKLIDSGNKVISEISGRVHLEKDRISVYPVYEVSGDAAATEGYIDFNGDVIVHGNVMDGMRIEAQGNIEIIGFAANSDLIARKNITVHKSIVSCNVQAGGNVLLYGKAKQKFQQVLFLTSELLNSLKMLERNSKNIQSRNKTGSLLKLLLEKNFSNLSEVFEECLKINSELLKIVPKKWKENFKETEQIFKKWKKITTGLGALQICSFYELKRMVTALDEKLQNVCEFINSGSEASKIVCGYVQNSKLEASGDIIITGKGSYNSHLVAGGTVEIKGAPGVFRGGSITALKDVQIRELGSPAEAKGFIQVDKKAKIVADIIYPGITVKCGARIEKILEQKTNFKFTNCS